MKLFLILWEIVKKYFLKPYYNLFNELNKVFCLYGGWKALFSSVYFQISVIATYFIFRYNQQNQCLLIAIFKLVKSITPSLLAFVLSGLAVFFAMASDEFRKLLSGSEKDHDGNITETSPLLDVAISFTHFSLFQALSLFNAILADLFHWNNQIYSCISIWLFVYSMLLIVASIMMLFATFTWYDEM